MTNHLSLPLLNALADGELSPDQLVMANEHLAVCALCTSKALSQSLLKSATFRAGQQRYAPPPHLLQSLAHIASQTPPQHAPGRTSQSTSRSSLASGFGQWGWATAAALLLVAVGIGFFVQRGVQRSQIASTQRTAAITEVFDQHIATLAANLPPQVLSSDRHTVKPWFQGKIPFSFNLPENLPPDISLDGADLTYLRNQPVAQLLYSIGKHKVSVFLRVDSDPVTAREALVEHAGFHVATFREGGLEGIAVSDVDPARLSQLLDLVERAQSGARQRPN